MQRIIRKLVHFCRHPWFMQVGFFPVWCLLGISRLLVLTLSFRRIAAHLGQHSGTVTLCPVITEQQRVKAYNIKRLIDLVSRYCPWKANCYPQAITARTLLNVYSVPYMLYFGLSKNSSGEMIAHAWVCSGDIRVSGGESFNSFTVVASYMSANLHQALQAQS